MLAQTAIDDGASFAAISCCETNKEGALERVVNNTASQVLNSGARRRWNGKADGSS